MRIFLERFFVQTVRSTQDTSMDRVQDIRYTLAKKKRKEWKSKNNVLRKLWNKMCFWRKNFSFVRMFCCICVIHKFGCKTETLDLPSMVVFFFFLLLRSTVKIYSLWKYFGEFVSTWQRKILFGIRNLFAKLFRYHRSRSARYNRNI